MTLRGGSEGVTLIFYLKHTLTFVIILQPSDVNIFKKIDVEIFGKISVLTSVKADLDLLA